MSAPKRFFIDNLNYPDETVVTIDGEEFVHAKTVLRLEVGAEITLLDNSGNEYSAIVNKIEKRSLSANIVGVNKGEREAATPVYLLVGALKGDKTELVVQKATELGIAKIGVFASEFCSAYMNDNKLERLNKVAREAAKQCYRSIAPTVEYFDSLQKALSSAESYDNKLFACEFYDRSDVNLKQIKGATAFVVGSEGGFSQAEFELAKQMGFAGITLGKRILRAETAAITMCSVVMFALGELE
jgi:16S rRNA (uracil1498-N3)-methyltransferase